MILDQFGRTIRYLRISITDHCNFRCLYCMPEDIIFRKSSDLMQFDEILFFVRMFASLGFDKYRLTGGEPTLHPRLVDLVHGIAQTPGVSSLLMTTNGVLLESLAQPLAQAGLQRVNISLDTIDPVKFHYLTRRGDIETVWRGIKAAEEAGLLPIKINMVVMDRYNLDEVVHLASLTKERPWQVRFIEMMPFDNTKDIQAESIVTAPEIQARVEADLGKLEVANEGELDGEALLFKIPGSRGTLGFIASVSHPFCDDCDRARLTADGRLRLCLLKDDELDLLTPLRSGASEDQIRQMILEGIWHKPKGHNLANGELPENRGMSQIGG
jgi:cyclic pyranopterin phosphate synthase